MCCPNPGSIEITRALIRGQVAVDTYGHLILGANKAAMDLARGEWPGRLRQGELA